MKNIRSAEKEVTHNHDMNKHFCRGGIEGGRRGAKVDDTGQSSFYVKQKNIFKEIT